MVAGRLGFPEGARARAPDVRPGIRPSFALEAFPDLDGDVRQSIARIQASPFLPHKDEVRDFVYDVRSGRLHEVNASSCLRRRAASPAAVATGS